MNARIYVIEDDENIQEIVKLSLESNGYQVTLFDNAIDAIIAIHEDAPDLAIFDVMLPQMDGITAVKKIRETNTQMPILILSAKDSEIDKIHGLDSGSDDYMTKPFGVLELCARVRTLLRRVQPKSKSIQTPTLCCWTIPPTSGRSVSTGRLTRCGRKSCLGRTIPRIWSVERRNL